MTVATPDRTLVLCRTWWEDRSEAAFVLRTIAGALSRGAPVEVVAPGPQPGSTPDGLFDVRSVGGRRYPGAWPERAGTRWPEFEGLVLALADDEAGAQLVRAHEPGLATLVVGRGGPATGGTLDAGSIGLPIAVNPLAAARPHNGFGFTDYLLVLTDRGARLTAGDREAAAAHPTAAVAWLAARFPRRHLVVVEDAEASAWLGRSLRGVIRVDTRTDLWRLMAHARLVVDLRPGPLVARECVEALHYGTPVVVPSSSAGRTLAEAGGGLWFDDPGQLLGCVDVLGDQAVRDELGRRGRAVAAERHGDADGFPHRIGELVRLGVRS